MLVFNYLHNRRQGVVLNGTTSEWRDLSAGLPQETVLGPYPFLTTDLTDNNISSEMRFFLLTVLLYFLTTKTQQKLIRDLLTVTN